jgi:hypothetical protein
MPKTLPHVFHLRGVVDLDYRPVVLTGQRSHDLTDGSGNRSRPATEMMTDPSLEDGGQILGRRSHRYSRSADRLD